MRMITDRIGQQEVLLAINHNHFYFPLGNTPRTIISSGDNAFCLTFLHFVNSLVFLWISGCCYGYCDNFCDWWTSGVDYEEYDWLLQLSDYRSAITANYPITLSYYNCTE